MEDISPQPLSLKINSPADYEIRVVGWLEESWLEFFADQSIVVTSQSGREPETTLMVHVLDQGALLGILNALNLFGLPLMHLEWMRMASEEIAPTSEEMLAL